MTAQRLEGKVALITGASRGLGLAVAEAYARAGARLLLVARDEKKLEEADDRIRALGGQATLLPFDLMETEKIASFGPAIAEKFGRLDIFVGNAAVLGTLGPAAHTDAKVWRNVLRVNLQANAALLRTLDPLLRASGHGRAIFTTCALGVANWAPYAASKAGLERLVLSYGAEAEFAGVKSLCIDPGVLATGLRAEAFPGEDPKGLPLPESAAGRFVEAAL
jgi:NAD(P)-dependent dehydrogenase (short-subunit alcohol dehydrogenase family)